MRARAWLLGAAVASACMLVACAAAGDDTKPKTPAREFASGRLFLSVDDALPIVSLGALDQRSEPSGLKLGDTTGPAGLARPIPLALDVGLEAGITFGASVVTQHEIASATDPGLENPAARERTHYTTLGVRAGWLVPIAHSLAVWTRISAAWTKIEERVEVEDRVDFRADTNLAIVPTGTWAIIAGPSLTGPGGRGEQGAKLEPQVGLSAGLVGRIDAPSQPKHDDDDVDEAPLGLPRVILGVERVVPLLRYDVIERDGPSTEGLPPHLTTRTLSGGSIDSKRSSPVSLARASLDVRAYEGLTVGAALAMGWARTGLGNHLIPGLRTTTTFTLGASPRVGWLARLSRVVMVWPRAGLTYYRADVDRPDVGSVPRHHLAVDFGAPFVFDIARGFGVTVSPDVSIPIVGSERAVPPYRGTASSLAVDAGAVDVSVLSASLSGGIVVLL